MFAEDIGGWLVAGIFLLGGIASAMLALVALIPAVKGKRLFTLAMIIPALLMCVLVTGWLIGAYRQRSFHDHEEIVENYLKPWLVMALPPLATSLIAGVVLLWSRLRNKKLDN